ncbi:hypothetical protein AB1Y20_009619 [Prymnesium parvum]|uniref:F-box/LRR-repeat protein 15-like leucin rich repeat domain-containing protein n=1 Tax=Prymnesium parvum TaxID=97485 RepID=A0AB34K4G4_PRYPA
MPREATDAPHADGGEAAAHIPATGTIAAQMGRASLDEPRCAPPEDPPADEPKLLCALLAGVHRHLSARDLAALAATCTAAAAAAAGPEFWSTLDLTPLGSVPAFLGSSLAHTRRFAAVTSLTVQFCPELLDEHLEAMPPWPLRSLSLDACHSLTDAGVKAALRKCGRTLCSLSLYWNNNLTKASALAVALHCPELRTLSFSGCGLVSSEGILAIASRRARLQSINLTRLPKVDDLALSALAQANVELHEVRLYAASQYTDTPIIALAKHCPQLQVLDCTGLCHLTDASISLLGEGCPQLRRLTLSWCKQISDKAVCAVAKGCKLELLSVHGNLNVTGASRAALVSNCAFTLQSLDVRGCTNFPLSTPKELLADFPHLRTFIIHT